MLKKLIFSLLLFCSFSTINAQQNVFLTIQPTFNGQPLDLAQPMNLAGTSFLLDHFDYYLSSIELVHDGGQVMDFTNQVFLFEPGSYTIYLGYLNVSNIEQISGYVGVPPNLNTSSGTDAIDITQYPSNHPLSFQEPSMYWGWTSGYMHMIVGGNCDQNTDGVFETLFELHNLGDQNYRGFILPVTQTQTSTDQIDIYLNCQLDQWLKDIPIESAGVSHGTTGLNLEVMKNVETEQVFTQPLTASVTHHPERRGEVRITSNDNQSTVFWSDIENLNVIDVVDAFGRIIHSERAKGNEGQLSFQHSGKGIFFIRMMDENNSVILSSKCMLN